MFLLNHAALLQKYRLLFNIINEELIELYISLFPPLVECILISHPFDYKSFHLFQMT